MTEHIQAGILHTAKLYTLPEANGSWPNVSMKYKQEVS